MVHEQMSRFYQGFRRDAHPMAVMCGVVGALAAFYHDGLDIFDPRHRLIASHRLVAKMPTIAAMAYKYAQGQPFIYPRNDLGYAENFLHMLFAVPCEPYHPPAAAVRALDALLIVQADHEQNASTSAMRQVGSTRANPYACTAAAIAALWGPLHGGANEGVLQTLAEIGTIDRIRSDLKYLAGPELEGRGIGSRGEELAVEYIAKQFAKAGLKPAGERGTFFQSVPLALLRKALSGFDIMPVRPSLARLRAPR